MGRGQCLLFLAFILWSLPLAAEPSSKTPALTPTVTVQKSEEKNINLDYTEPKAPVGSTTGALLKALLSLALIVILIYLSIAGLKLLLRGPRGPLKTRASIQLLEMFPLSPSRTLYLIQCRESVFLVAFSEKGVALLKEWEKGTGQESSEFQESLGKWSQAVEEKKSPLTEFEDRLKSLWKKRS